MSDRLNTQDLIDLLINRQGFEKKDAENFIKEFFLLIEEGLQKDKVVKIKGLGTFKLVDVESRESVNVNTGERFEIQEHTKISFTPEATLRDIINKPFAHFETVILRCTYKKRVTHFGDRRQFSKIGFYSWPGLESRPILQFY